METSNVLLSDGKRPANPGDAEWDDYLRRNPRGQFQQTTGWARVKELDGWRAHRILVDPADVTLGGCQLLWKQTRLGAVGYVGKGPVLPVEEPDRVDAFIINLKRVARGLGLRALALQPPDQSGIAPSTLVSHGFCPRPIAGIIRATAMIELGGGREEIMHRMNRQVRREARISARHGVVVRAGERSDLRRFFELMRQSCRRQQARPNPARPEALERLWDVFAPDVHVRFAICGGEVIAGLLMVGHGRRLTFWKKGWAADAHPPYANCLLHADALCWASDQGYSHVDFAGLAEKTARSLLGGHPLGEEQRRSRDFFNLRCGATPYLLPPGQLLILNRALRCFYRVCSSWPVVEARLLRPIGGV